jgi:hypothetical protein
MFSSRQRQWGLVTGHFFAAAGMHAEILWTFFYKGIDKCLLFCDIACESSRIQERRLIMKNNIVTAAARAPSTSDGHLKMLCFRTGLAPGFKREPSFYENFLRLKTGQPAASCESHLKDISEIKPTTGGPMKPD